MGKDGKDNDDDILKLVTEIVSAYVSKNPVAAHELPAIIKNVHATLGGFAEAREERTLPRAPAWHRFPSGFPVLAALADRSC